MEKPPHAKRAEVSIFEFLLLDRAFLHRIIMKVFPMYFFGCLFIIFSYEIFFQSESEPIMD